MKVLTKNRKALRNYEVIEKFLAGIVLAGYEVKAIREGKANLEGSYVKVSGGEAFVTNMKISQYSKQSQKGAPTDRDRKLLLTKNDIQKIAQATQQKGKTAVPLALLLHHNMIKLELAVVKGRKKYEKKHLEKERQIQKDLEKQRKDIRG